MSFLDSRDRVRRKALLVVVKGAPISLAGQNVPFIFTGEFLLRGVIKVLLSELGYDNAWRSERWRTLDAAYERGGMLSPLLVAVGAPLSADRSTDVFEGPMDSPSERGI